MKNREIKNKLKQESTNFVPDIKDKVYQSVGYHREQKSRIKFGLKPTLVFMVVFLLALFIFIMPTSITNSYVLVEINPAIEIEVDNNNKVVNTNPLNTDGYFFLEKVRIENLFLDEALVTIINQAKVDEYLTATDGTIYVSAVNKNEKIEENLNETINNTLRQHAPNHIKNDEEVKKAARENNISPGRMFIIKRAMEIDSSLELADALKMEVKDLVTIMNSKAKSKIDGFEDQYKNNLQILEKIKESNLNELDEKRINFEQRFDELEDLVDRGICLNELEEFVNLNFPKYEFDRNNFVDLDDGVDDLFDYYEDNFDFIEDLIEEKFALQKEIYKNKINKNANNNSNDFSFEFETDFSFDKFHGRYSDDEREVILIISKILILNNNKFPGVKSQINKLYDDYKDLMDDVSDDFKNSEIVINFEEKFNNSKGKK